LDVTIQTSSSFK